MIKKLQVVEFFTKPDTYVGIIEKNPFSFTPVNNLNYQPLKGA